MRGHESEDYLTKTTAVGPSGDCPQWLNFLEQITGGDKDLQIFLQRMAGYSLTGSIKEQSLFFLYGTGGNGKGVFLNTITAIMGDYTTTAGIETFTASHTDRHPTELAMLQGARLVTAQEIENGKRWAESKIKAITGGDPITARYMRQDFFTYEPQFKLVIAGNHKPEIRNVDPAIRRRIHLIPFIITIPPANMDKDLSEKLKAEWSGILQWMIEGAKDWYEYGLAAPESVKQATSEYLEDEDAIEQWIKQCCHLGPAYTATATDLYTSWCKWCEETGECAGSQKRLSQDLKSKFTEFEKWQCPKTRRMGYRGIEVINKHD